MRNLLLTLLVALLLAPQVTFAALTDNLVSYWKLEEASGSRADAHGLETLTDNNTVTSAMGKINNAADFERGNSEYLSSTGDLGITNGAISFSAWINPESLPSVDAGASSGEPNVYTVVSKGDAGTDVKYSIFLGRAGGTQYVYFMRLKENVDVNNVQYATTLSTGAFYHLVLTYDGTDIKGYISGSLVGTTGATGNGASGASDYTSIGSGQNSSSAQTSFFDGLVDEVGVWNRALTPDEVSDLYNNGDGLAYPLTVAEEASEDILWFF